MIIGETKFPTTAGEIRDDEKRSIHLKDVKDAKPKSNGGNAGCSTDSGGTQGAENIKVEHQKCKKPD